MKDTDVSAQLTVLHGAVLDIVGVMNGPQRDEVLVAEAGILLDRVLFPLLVIVDRRGPIGVVDLADRVGRDYTTVSRQLDKLDKLGLIERKPGVPDRRVREATVTTAGKAMNDAIDAARERLMTAAFASWEHSDLAQLSRLMRRFADSLARS